MSEFLKNRLNLFYILGLIALIVLPTAVTLGLHHVSRDPNLRPFSVTQQSLAAYERATGTGSGVEIVAQVEWDRATAEVSQRHMRRAITDAFRSKGVEVYVAFVSGGEATRVTYVVGHSRIGPFPAHRAAEGVSAAVDAYRMHAPTS